MNPFILRLAAATIPHAARLAGAALAGIRFRARRALRIRTWRARKAVLRAFAAAAMQKWF